MKMKQRIIISKCLEHELENEISKCEPDKLFIITDETTNDLNKQILSELRQPTHTRRWTLWGMYGKNYLTMEQHDIHA